MRHYEKRWRPLAAADLAKNTFNPIRNILETMVIKPNPEKKMISLSIGDPTVFGNLSPHQNIIDSVVDSVKSGKNNGYGPSTGSVEARKAVAKHVSVPGAEISHEDVILCSGCSCSLDLCIAALANPGQNILIPRPGFPLYSTLANGYGIETKEYDLIPECGWAVDLDHMESQIDENTVAIVVNNPSNPCGAVFTPEHLTAILEIADRHCLPIIADEIYDYFVFSDQEYVPIASLTETVPVLSCGGLTKRYLVPGWRMGWITVHDRNGIFGKEIRGGLQKLSQRIIGANTIVQGALPAILENTPQSFFDSTVRMVEDNAEMAFRMLSEVPGLRPVMPSGAMYMMVGIDRSLFPQFENDLQIVESLVREESVFPLPGKCFNIPDYFRIVLTVPGDLMAEACDRIKQFCDRHSVYDLASRREVPDKVKPAFRLRLLTTESTASCDSGRPSSSSSEPSSSSSEEESDEPQQKSTFSVKPKAAPTFRRKTTPTSASLA